MNRLSFLEGLRFFGERNNIPNISPQSEKLLSFFCTLLRPKRILEIGCANGYSTIFLADILEKWRGKILSCDTSIPMLRMARENIRAVDLHNTELRFGSGLEVIRAEDGFFDLIFLDAQKSKSHLFFAHCAPMLAEKGVILVDDVRRFPEKMKSLKNLLHREHNIWRALEIPVEEGDSMLAVVRKKEASLTA